ncbi:MAG: dienelactone hydrolase family protein [Gemmatimonadaceae bacterium]|nr:dienelactone hydrolase family protein [Gemmatimonadaceae bacterium]
MLHRLSAISALLLTACTLQRVSPSMSSESSAPLDEHSAHMRAADLVAPSTASQPDRGAQQGTPGLPASNQTAAARLAATPRHGEWVKIAWTPGSADSLMAWIVYPKAGAKAPVVVVVHEIFGLSTWVRAVADQAAADGFIAIAPDFLSRVRGGPSSIELPSDTARRLIAGVDAAERNRAVVAAANYAMTQPAATQKYAVIGYCWGGSTTFYHAVNGGVSGFSGGVAFYGLPYMSGGAPATATSPAVAAKVDADSLAKITKPILLLNGSKDARIAAAMPALDSTMKRLGKTYTGVNYEGAVHGFLRAQNDPKAARDEAEEAANYAATKDGWPRTVAFLRTQLGVK